MKLLLIPIIVLMFAACSTDDKPVIYCPIDCKVNHLHHFADGTTRFGAEEWKDDTQKE